MASRQKFTFQKLHAKTSISSAMIFVSACHCYVKCKFNTPAC